MLARQAERQLQGVQPLPSRQGETPLRSVQPLPSREAEKRLRELQPLPSRQAEMQLRCVQPLHSRQAEKRLLGVQWFPPRQAKGQVRGVQNGTRGCAEFKAGKARAREFAQDQAGAGNQARTVHHSRLLRLGRVKEKEEDSRRFLWKNRKQESFAAKVCLS